MKILIGVGAVIRSGDMVLVQDHVKSGCWTITVGKAEGGETPLEAITRELWEELGLIVIKGSCLLDIEQYCEIHGAVVRQVVFDIEVSNTGGWKNKEPEKHREVRWMEIRELIKKDKLTENTKLWLAL